MLLTAKKKPEPPKIPIRGITAKQRLTIPVRGRSLKKAERIKKLK